MALNLKNLTIAQLTNANVAVYTPINASVSAKITSASAYNADASDHTIDVYIVASGGAGSAAAGTQIYALKLVPAGQSVSLDLLVAKNIIGAGSLVAKASVTSQVTLAVSGVETS
jgi:ATP-dependent protease ClpP protease subunit